MTAREHRPSRAEVAQQASRHRTDTCLHLNVSVLTLTDRRSGTEVVTHDYSCDNCPAKWST